MEESYIRQLNDLKSNIEKYKKIIHKYKFQEMIRKELKQGCKDHKKAKKRRIREQKKKHHALLTAKRRQEKRRSKLRTKIDVQIVEDTDEEDELLIIK